MYCTADQARARGASGDDNAVAVAIREAMERIDAYTGDTFEPETRTRELRVTGDYAPTRQRLLEVELITVHYPAETEPRTIPAAGYTRDPHGLRFRTWGSDVLIAGAEPWRGGWAGLVGPLDGNAVSVRGTWGWEYVPSQVREACALVAADLTPSTFVPVANAEGDAVGVPPVSKDGLRDPEVESVRPAERRDRTTGNAAADRLLAVYIASPYKFG